MLCQVEGPWALYPSLAEKKQEYIVYEKELSTRESQRIFKKNWDNIHLVGYTYICNFPASGHQVLELQLT